MAKYILVYKGGRAPSTEEDRAALMRAWRVWVEGLGLTAIDPGNPFGPSVAIAPDGTTNADVPSELRGYFIFTADDLASATAIARGCPHLTTYGAASAGTVEIYEALPID